MVSPSHREALPRKEDPDNPLRYDELPELQVSLSSILLMHGRIGRVLKPPGGGASHCMTVSLIYFKLLRRKVLRLRSS